MARRIARVLIDSPVPQLDRLFDYAVPEHLSEDALPGVRVRVPLRSMGRLVDGFIVELGEENEADRVLSDLETVVSPAQVLPSHTYELARKVADRAAGSASDVLRFIVPKRQVRVEKAWIAAGASERAESESAVPASTAPVEEPLATTVMDLFPGLADQLAAHARIVVDAPAYPTVLASGETVGTWAVLLAEAGAHAFARGESAVFVVPDYRDQGELLAALAERVPEPAIVRSDARQSGPERYKSFLRTLEDAPCIVVGNRSAVYAPVRPGLIAIWDDGDSLLEEPLAPYVHARDAALVRQELSGAALLFSSHTRSADVERLVQIGWVREVPAARRYSPRVVLSSTTEHERSGARVPSAAFRAAREALQHGPVLVQVSRPGYAPVLVCAECRKPARCSHCAGPLFAKARGAAPVCRWCERTSLGWRCPHCDSDRVRLASSGSERTADELGRAFPGTRVIVADGEHPVLHVDEAPALVVATRGAEPIAAGGYRAVLLLDGERMLLADDLRIAEACLRWWSNAAALAAPSAPVHLVAVTGAVARALATGTQSAFARAELADRAPLRMPPVVRTAVVQGDLGEVNDALRALRESVPELSGDSVIGPVSIETDSIVPAARALVRFDYGLGIAVVGALRGSVIAAAMRSRRARKGTKTATRSTLRVRLDVADPQI